MEYIKINNKQYPVKFGLNAMRLYCKEKKKELDYLTGRLSKINLKKIKLDDLDFMAELILFSITDGLRKEGKPTDHGLDIGDFYDLVESDQDALEKLFSILGEGMPDDDDTEKPKN